MTYLGVAVLVLFLLSLTSAGWYWLFKRFERRMSERFDDVATRANENFRVLEIVFDRTYELPNKVDKAVEEAYRTRQLSEKLDIVQGLLLVLKQDRVLKSALEAALARHRDGRLGDDALAWLDGMIKDMQLENLSRY